MSKTLQIRNVPEALHRQLKMRAAKRGQSISDYRKEIAERELASPASAASPRIPAASMPPHSSAANAIFALYMRGTCFHAESMSKTLQIRNVPEALHRQLKIRAAKRGQGCG